MRSDASSERLFADDQVASSQSARVAARLKFYFAMLSCLGGLVLAAGNDTESIPVIAVFFAVFGYVFVDWLELFALPPVAAYAAMAVAALYCVSDFSDLDAPGNRQMVAVAQLLVFVQAILMLQRKSRRIFEQLGVFCLLELIVAAVFNNAINYGLLLVPIAIIGGWALSLLSAVSAWDGLDHSESLDRDDAGQLRLKKTIAPTIRVSAPQSVRSLAESAGRLPRIALVALAPPVLLVGATFFYALPRTTDAARLGSGGNALIGFSETLQLQQIGNMLQNHEPALRIELSPDGGSRSYDVMGGLYLRGCVLERYQPNFQARNAAATWSSIPNGPISGSMRLPAEFHAPSSHRNFFDSVNCKITCESMRTPALFAIAPYHRRRPDPDIVHSVERWTIARSSEEWVYPRISYSFGSNAFFDHRQTDLIARRATSEWAAVDVKREGEYEEALKSFDVDLMPTAASLAAQIVGKMRESSRTQFQIAKQLEQHLAVGGGFRYTLRLDAESVPGLDPIEQFLSVDRKGHCQYFASALVMMLRSQGIPARVVVGYRTDEYNELADYYVARQSHAHAWVEALIDNSQLPDRRRIVYGQGASDQYWLRLDPTPGGGGGQGAESGGVGQVFDFAEKMWDEYVVDMDAQRQDDALLSTPGLTPMSDSYKDFINVLTNMIDGIRAGRLGGGALASRQLFSWPAALACFVIILAFFVLLKLRAPGWIKRRIQAKMAAAPLRPKIDFYDQTLQQLARLGVVREPSQTPAELALQASLRLGHERYSTISQPLGILTSAFYALRFGTSQRSGRNSPAMPQIDQALVQLKRGVDQITASHTLSEPLP